MFAGIGVAIGKWAMESALMTSPAGPWIIGAGKLFKKIPWQVWAAIAIAIALWIGVKWHAHEVHKTYQAGYQQAVADIKAKEAKLVAPLKEAKAVGDATIATVNEGVKKNHDTQAAHIDVNVADLLSMYTTAGGDRSVSGGRVSDASGQASGGPAAARADDGLAGASQAGRPTITVDARELITRAGICDRDYIALTSWEDAYAGWQQAYAAWAAKVKAAPTH